jgi:hypothetical protein
VTEPGRVALLVVVAWLLAVALALRALVRQQRAPSILDRPRLPERYRVADDLTQPIAVVVEAAEAEAR